MQLIAGIVIILISILIFCFRSHIVKAEQIESEEMLKIKPDESGYKYSVRFIAVLSVLTFFLGVVFVFLYLKEPFKYAYVHEGFFLGFMYGCQSTSCISISILVGIYALCVSWHIFSSRERMARAMFKSTFQKKPNVQKYRLSYWYIIAGSILWFLIGASAIFYSFF